MAIRAVVVDDSALYRRVLSEALRAMPGVEVAATASNGTRALEYVRELRPQLLTLDIDMPGADGLEVLDTIRQSGYETSVVVVSSVSVRTGTLAMRALQKGAFDFIAKPEQSSPEANRQLMLAELAPRIRAIAQRLELRSIMRGSRLLAVRSGPAGSQGGSPVSSSLQQTATRMNKLACSNRPEMVLIGVSTGGPNALTRLIPQLPSNLGVPVVIVQHMPPLFTQLLAEDLCAKSQIRVREASDGERLCANTAYIAPGGKQMRLGSSVMGPVVQITDDPPENHCRPSVDYLFRSVAQTFPGNTMAVILTGMGDDGTRGLRLLKQRGCTVVAQEEASCVVFGMPKAAIDAGVVDCILPIDSIASRITAAMRGVSE